MVAIFSASLRSEGGAYWLDRAKVVRACLLLGPVVASSH
jgi:hypothetical protein